MTISQQIPPNDGNTVTPSTITVPTDVVPPLVQISNAKIAAAIYLPDPHTGFYRGVRFDWAGVIADLQFAGHHLYRPWFSAVDPELDDFEFRDNSIVVGRNSAITGPAEEFDEPLGYETAKPGGTFVKIGVGLLRRLDNKAYSFRTPYPLVDSGAWTTRHSKQSITFEQTFNNPAAGYGYIYTKTIRLIADTAQLVIEHRLRNVGRLAIRTRVYNHNFLTVDDQPAPSGCAIRVPYQIKPRRAPDPQLVTISGNTAEYLADLERQEPVAFGLQGFSSSPTDYDFVLTHPREQIQVRVVGDHPLTDAVVWSIRTVIAVEPFINIVADPAKKCAWSYTYTYSELQHPSFQSRTGGSNP